MKKLVMLLLIFTGIIVLAGCKPVGPSDIDCTVNPEHEDCIVIDPNDCESNPDNHLCDTPQSFRNSYLLLDIEDEEANDYQTVYYQLEDLISEIETNTIDYKWSEYENYISLMMDSATGITPTALLDQQDEESPLLFAIESSNIDLLGLLSHLAFNHDIEEFNEGETETVVTDTSSSSTTVILNEDSMHYVMEAQETGTFGQEHRYLEISVAVIYGERLVYEILSYYDDGTDMDYNYTLFDSEVGYITKDIYHYGLNLVYMETIVDEINHTITRTQFDLGEYVYLSKNEFDIGTGLSIRTDSIRNPEGNEFTTKTIGVYEDFKFVLSYQEEIDNVGQAEEVTRHTMLYNVLYLDSWDKLVNYTVYDGTSNEAIVDVYSFELVMQKSFMFAAFYDDIPTMAEFISPDGYMNHTYLSYTEFQSLVGLLDGSNNPITLGISTITVDGVVYNLSTDLEDLFLSNLPTNVKDRIQSNSFLQFLD